MNALTPNLADELTALNEEARHERTLANIARRASTLFEDGYTATQTLAGQFVNCYTVTTPGGCRYTVKTSRTPAANGTFFGSKCSCPCFEKELTCKHLQALELQEAQEAALETEWEQTEEARDFFDSRAAIEALRVDFHELPASLAYEVRERDGIAYEKL